MPSHRKLIRLLWLEATFAVAYDTWVGPSYLSGVAGELGLDLRLVSILVAIPWIGATGQILGLRFFARGASVKNFVAGLALLGRALWAVPLTFAAVGAYRARFHREPFPTATWFVVAVVSACLASLLTSASANAWLYWMKNLIPPSFQGRFFGCRNRYMTVAYVAASVIGAFCVGWKPHGYLLGYGVLGALAIAAGMASVRLHYQIPDVSGKKRETTRPLRTLLTEPLRDPEFRRLLLFSAAFNGSVQLASSYFPYYFTKTLGLSMGSVVLWGGLSNAGSFLSSQVWGSLVDRNRFPYSVLWWAGHWIALSPLFYLSANPATIAWVAPGEYLASGMITIGFTLTQIKLLLARCLEGNGAACFSLYAATLGVGGAIATFLGGQTAALLANHGGFPALWVISATTRIGVLWLFCRPLLEERESASARSGLRGHRAAA